MPLGKTWRATHAVARGTGCRQADGRGILLLSLSFQLPATRVRQQYPLLREPHTLGHLLALRVSAANEQDRAQVAAQATAVQEETGQSVQLAYVDQGYTGAEAAQDAHDHGIALEVVKLPVAR